MKKLLSLALTIASIAFITGCDKPADQKAADDMKKVGADAGKAGADAAKAGADAIKK